MFQGNPHPRGTDKGKDKVVSISINPFAQKVIAQQPTGGRNMKSKRRTKPGRPTKEEKDGLLRGSPAAKGGLSTAWKFFICVLIGVIAVLATTSVEIKLSNNGSGGKSMAGSVEEKNVTDSVEGGDSPSDSATEATPVATAATSATVAAAGATTVTTAATAAASSETPAAANSPAKGDDTLWAYNTRGQTITAEEKARLTAKYGSWSLTDESARPNKDMMELYKKYPNRDVPWADFPATAWQKNQAYLTQFLDQAEALTMRAMEAILAEYGHGLDDEPGTDFTIRSQMFRLQTIEDDKLMETPPAGENIGGWTTPRSWNGLKRRLLHAIVSEDSFVFAMGGHSAAAGHGNHFSQSYTLQVGWILEPIFARLGVKHQSRNFGNGGMGTTQNGLAAGSMFGPDVDMLMWDSGMTEPGERDPDLMARQGIIGGLKVPVLWAFPPGVLKKLHRFGNAEVGSMGTSYSGIPVVSTVPQLNNVTWAARYMRCSNEIQGNFCKPHEFSGTCWIPRDDFTPATAQLAALGGRASWHPGNRFHQLKGRTLAFTILLALHEAIQTWRSADGHVLSDDLWHVTSLYEDIRKSVTDIAPQNSPCYGLNAMGLTNFCKYPMKGRSEFTAHAYPDISSLRAIMPKEQLAVLNDPPPVAYHPPDVFNPHLHPPAGEIDVLNIVENGPAFRQIVTPSFEHFYDNAVTGLDAPTQKVGKGHFLQVPAGFCDGSLDSWCDRGNGVNCLMYAHNDARSGIMFESKSGWLLFNVPKVKRGFIVIKLETWHFQSESPRTKGWTSINNEGDARYLRHNSSDSTIIEEKDLATSDGRSLKKPAQEPFCDQFRFEFAINGVVTTQNNTVFNGSRKHIQRVVELFTLVNDEELTGGVEKDVEVGMRITGCKEFKISHIYWA